MLDIDKSRQRPGSALEVLGVFERITVIFIIVFKTWKGNILVLIVSMFFLF